MTSKKFVVKSLEDGKYGNSQRGVFAVEPISKHELVFQHLEHEYPYFDDEDPRGKYTKEELLKLIEDKPKLKELFSRQIYYIGNGRYNAPVKFMNEDFSNVEECQQNFSAASFINHSCDPNIHFPGDNGYALRNIAAGEELTFDYNTVDDENSPRYGLACKCGSGDKCVKILRFDRYRDPAWVKENEQCCLSYIKERIAELRKAGELP